jgi:hypothetical protein
MTNEKNSISKDMRGMFKKELQFQNVTTNVGGEEEKN